MGNGRAKKSQNAVTHQPGHRPFITIDAGNKVLEGTINNLRPLFRIQLPGRGRRSLHIREQHGHNSSFTLHLPMCSSSFQLLKQLSRDISLKMHLGRFLLLDLLGTVLWIVTTAGVGYLFSDHIAAIARSLSELGVWGLTLLAGLLAIFLVWKWIERRRFRNTLAIERITPQELDHKLRAGEDVVVVDLRHRVEFSADPHSIPGALHLPAEEVEARLDELPVDRDVVLYCT